MTIYIDMDGVIAKWNETPVEETKKPGYFLAREPEDSAIKLVKALRKLGANECRLSAVWNNECAKEKSVWLDRYFDAELERIFVPCDSNKADYITGGINSILIDDFSKNLREWKASGNIPIKFYNGINGTKGTYTGHSISKEMNVGEMLEVISQAA